ncbi:YdcF family protein [Kribbella sp.]|uniref:YdcF family protein n=1 Tax=Kribbella sp. TaxID=1871183 RepID=UPI002D5A5417|nr:YdcF family protein [Kribbella sp.]HZX05504.1 YdcF family protein [Kribbella sp.]
MIVSFGVAGLWLVVFAVNFLRDRRLLLNGVYLVLACLFALAGLVFALERLSRTAAEVVVVAVLIAIMLSVAVLAVFLIWNGLIMFRREGRRLGNLLSLLAGLAIVALGLFGFLTERIGWRPLEIVQTSLLRILAYVSFLFVCFLVYSTVYSWVAWQRPIDFIVVLGSALRGTRVPPLLASRLDRAREVFEQEQCRPLLITSGGQGRGEEIPESHAMAEYLVEHGVPADRIRREDRSRSTTENLVFSAQIMQALKPAYRCLIVTNNFHAFRAAMTARRAKVDGQVIGSPTAQYYWPSATLREFVAILVQHRWDNLTVCAVIVAGVILQNL